MTDSSINPLNPAMLDPNAAAMGNADVQEQKQVLVEEYQEEIQANPQVMETINQIAVDDVVDNQNDYKALMATVNLLNSNPALKRSVLQVVNSDSSVVDDRQRIAMSKILDFADQAAQNKAEKQQAFQQNDRHQAMMAKSEQALQVKPATTAVSAAKKVFHGSYQDYTQKIAQINFQLDAHDRKDLSNEKILQIPEVQKTFAGLTQDQKIGTLDDMRRTHKNHPRQFELQMARLMAGDMQVQASNVPGQYSLKEKSPKITQERNAALDQELKDQNAGIRIPTEPVAREMALTLLRADPQLMNYAKQPLPPKDKTLGARLPEAAIAIRADGQPLLDRHRARSNFLQNKGLSSEQAQRFFESEHTDPVLHKALSTEIERPEAKNKLVHIDKANGAARLAGTAFTGIRILPEEAKREVKSALQSLGVNDELADKWLVKNTNGQKQDRSPQAMANTLRSFIQLDLHRATPQAQEEYFANDQGVLVNPKAESKRIQVSQTAPNLTPNVQAVLNDALLKQFGKNKIPAKPDMLASIMQQVNHQNKGDRLQLSYFDRQEGTFSNATQLAVDITNAYRDKDTRDREIMSIQRKPSGYAIELLPESYTADDEDDLRDDARDMLTRAGQGQQKNSAQNASSGVVY